MLYLMFILLFRQFHFYFSAWPMDHLCAGTLAQSRLVHYLVKSIAVTGRATN